MLEFNGVRLTGTLGDSAAAQDLARLLPLTLDLEDYGATEKIADLPRRLDTTGEPAGVAASVGDLCYYAPWGNLALFLRPFRHSAGLVRLGKLAGDLGALRKAGPVTARLDWEKE